MSNELTMGARMKRLLLSAIPSLFLGIGAFQASAATATFDSATDFVTAFGDPLMIETFDQLTEPDPGVESASRLLNSTGTSFEVTSGGVTTLNGNFTLDGGGITNFLAPLDPLKPDEITVTLPGSFEAVGFDFKGVNGSAAAARALLNIAGAQVDLLDFDDIPGGAGAGFIGFIFDAPISSFTFTPLGATGQDSFRIDNLQFGNSVAEIPLPLSGIMLLSGLGILAFSRRRMNATA